MKRLLSKDQKQFPDETETKIHSWVQHTSLGSSSPKLIAVKMLNKILLTLVVLKVYVTGLYNKIIQFSPIMQHYDINISFHWLLETLGEGITFHCQSPAKGEEDGNEEEEEEDGRAVSREENERV